MNTGADGDCGAIIRSRLQLIPSAVRCWLRALGFGRKSTAQATLEVSPSAAPTLVDVGKGSQATPTRRPRSCSTSKSLMADSRNELVAEPKSAKKKKRQRSRLASTQPEQTS